ncbi:MAG: hypothetical protein D6705_02320 [Deltaproteobacteria bacterium]|nr:MAG: hypothetical protein D6705_02320 [Deltaproteobacteria bacterium]
MGEERSKERRRSERIPVNREFRGGAESYVSELSEHGLFLHTTERVPVGTTVALHFTLLLDDPVRVDAVGTVVRHQDDPPGMGIAFGELDPVTVLRLSDAIARLRPRPAGPPIAPGSRGRAAPPKLSGSPVKARTVRVRPVGGNVPEVSRDEVSDDDKTLIRLRPVDMEIVEEDDDETAFFDGDDG